MGLTWDEFLKLASVISNLGDSIYYFQSKFLGTKEKNRRVAAAAEDYQELFDDLKYMQFMNELRISFTNLIIIFNRYKPELATKSQSNFRASIFSRYKQKSGRSKVSIARN